MEWIGSGLTLIFTGLLVLVITACGYAATPAAIVTYRMAALLLIARSILVSFTGARDTRDPDEALPADRSGCGHIDFHRHFNLTMKAG
jgi:hypothetical protein